MNNDKAKQEISVIGRLFCLEAFLLLMGLYSLGSGIYTGEITQLFYGGLISCGAVVLYFVRKKDWKKHWEEQERQRQLYDAQEKARQEREHDRQK